MFVTNPTLAASDIKDLLCIRQIGHDAMFSYIRQHTSIPPTELKQKRRRQKLETFIKTRDYTK